MINEVYNCDCLEYMKTCKDNQFDHVLTSPPYNRSRNDKYKNYNDNKKDYYNWLKNIIDELLRTTDKYIFFNIQTNMDNIKDIYKLFGLFNEFIKENFIWVKSNPQPNHYKGCINNAYEFIIVFSKSLNKRKGFEICNKDNLKNVIITSVNSNNIYKDINGAVMHGDIPDFFIYNFTNKNELIFDPFIGTGTTAKTCIKLDRNYCGCEIDLETYNICKKEIYKENLIKKDFKIFLNKNNKKILKKQKYMF